MGSGTPGTDTRLLKALHVSALLRCRETTKHKAEEAQALAEIAHWRATRKTSQLTAVR